jgi:predicted acyltransferase
VLRVSTEQCTRIERAVMPHPTSFACAVSWVAGWYLVLLVMERRGIVIKI